MSGGVQQMAARPVKVGSRSGAVGSALLSAANALLPARVPPISYRQLDHWCRLGYITLSGPAQGSGSRRSATEGEIAALAAVAVRLAELDDAVRYVTSGDYFAALIAATP